MVNEKWLVDGEKTIELGPIKKLKVSLFAGQVDIVGHDEPTTRIEVHSVRGKGLRIAIDGESLEIDHPQLAWDNFIDVFKSLRSSARADVSIVVPRDVALKFGVVSASGLISGLTGDATISTVSGDLVIDGVRGDLQVNSVSGEVGIRNHHGEISVHTISGEVTATGELHRFSADSVSGSVFLDVVGTPDVIKVNTVSGSVTARLASGVAAQYRINTVSGRLQLDDSEIRGVRGSFTGKYGKLEKSWLEFKANTVSGDISVLHTVSV
jgi:Putative adhesin